MKGTKQIREQFDLITEKEEKEDKKLSALVRAGLYDAKKLPALKRALDKSADKISAQEKRMLVNLLDSLISQVVSDDQVYRKVRQNVHNVNEAKMDTYSRFDPRYKAGYPTDKELPSVLILKRKAIRVYPDNQKVALYYSQALDKYVTIPYNDIQTSLNEAKKDDDKKRVPRPRIRSKNLSTMKNAINTAHMVNRNAEYENIGTEIKDSQKKGYSAAVTIGGILHSRSVRNRLQGSKDKVRQTLDKVRASSSQSAPKSTPAPASSAPAPKPTPAAAPKVSNPKALYKPQAATRAAITRTRNKNPNVPIEKRSLQHANMSEEFRLKIKQIREDRQIDEGALQTADDFMRATGNMLGGNYVAAAGDYAVKKLIGRETTFKKELDQEYEKSGSAAERSPTATTAGHVAGTALGLVGAGKIAGSVGAGGRLAGLAGKVARGAGTALGALSGAGGSGGSGTSSTSSSGGVKPNFNTKLPTSKSFDTNRASTTKTIEKRRQIANDRANSQLAKSQTNESNVLDTIKSIVENNISEQTIQFNENKITINNTVAKKLLNVYESVNKTNKKKMENMLNESATSFNKVLTFAVRQ